MEKIHIYQELFILIGTTYADGVLLHNIFKPFCANGFPVLLLVPSGKLQNGDAFLCLP
jgi:hypothetical protein